MDVPILFPLIGLLSLGLGECWRGALLAAMCGKQNKVVPTLAFDHFIGEILQTGRRESNQCGVYEKALMKRVKSKCIAKTRERTNRRESDEGGISFFAIFRSHTRPAEKTKASELLVATIHLSLYERFLPCYTLFIPVLPFWLSVDGSHRPTFPLSRAGNVKRKSKRRQLRRSESHLARRRHYLPVLLHLSERRSGFLSILWKGMGTRRIYFMVNERNEQAFQGAQLPASQGVERQEQWSFEGLEEEVLSSSFPRFYFSTDQHLYALVYKRTQRGYGDTPFIKTPLYQLDFLTPLIEMPFTGDSWQRILTDLGEEDEPATLVHLSPKYGSRLGHFTLTRPNARPLDVDCLVLVRPSHTTEEIAQRLARDGDLWHVKATDRHERSGGSPPPQPSAQSVFSQEHVSLYDVFARGRFLAALGTYVRLPLRDALQIGERLAVAEHGLLFRYAEPEDTLEWLNPRPTLEARLPEHPPALPAS